ncbi:MAG: hypothetical protein U9P00_00855 [Pseudomonadota bacterium]|nr:hypothetical protein [Pseudomonadota bacterium]
MKKAIITTFVILSLGVGLPASQVLAAPESGAQASQENAEQGWLEALKTQVALAKAKVSLLQARAELWLEQNQAAALQSLDETRANLDEGWRSADQVTRARITELKLQVDQASKLLREKAQEADVELHAMADRSESALNAALAQVQARSAALRDEAATRYGLVQAKAAALEARIALEIDKSPERAQQALQDAENYLQQAKASASKATAEKIAQLQDKVQAAKQAVREEADMAKSRIGALVMSTEERIQAYGKTIQESEEAKLLMKRYGQLEAKAALLKANLAAKTDATGKQTVAYLDESKAWYDSLKSQASRRWHKELTDMTARVDEAKQAVERKDKQARAKLAELLERAAAMLKDEESGK